MTFNGYPDPKTDLQEEDETPSPPSRKKLELIIDPGEAAAMIKPASKTTPTRNQGREAKQPIIRQQQKTPTRMLSTRLDNSKYF